MKLIDSVLKHCTDLTPTLVEDHFFRLPQSYFDQHSVAQIARHLHLISQLSHGSLVLVDVQVLTPQLCEVQIVGLDCVGALAAITTTLMTEGLNIQDVRVANYIEEVDKPTYFIDEFRVSSRQAVRNAKEIIDRLQKRLSAAFDRLASGKNPDGSSLQVFDGSVLGHDEHTVVRRDLLENAVIGDDFHLQSQMAAGGMSSIYLAEQISTGRTCVVKVLKYRDDVLLEELQSRFEREARILREFKSPRIVELLASGVFRDPQHRMRPWMALEFVASGDLAAWLQRQGPPPLDKGLSWFRQSLEALHYSHSRGVVHRDVKPHNLLLTSTGDVKLTDFGLVKELRTGNISHTMTGAILGTPHYMSPEQALGEALDERSDIYSMGATFYKIFAGRLPREAESATQVLARVVQEETPTLAKTAPHLAGPLSVILARMMARHREERYQEAAVVLADLDSFVKRGLLKPEKPVAGS